MTMGVKSGDDDRPEPLGRGDAGWVRFDRYEVRDRIIRPAPGARSEPYDPWEDYAAARRGRGGESGRAPYESLLELVWSVQLGPARPDEPMRLRPASERALLAWCASHGLLGILPHRTEVAYLLPRWTPADRFAKLRALGLMVVPAQRSYSWGQTGWWASDEGKWPAVAPRGPRSKLLGEPVSRRYRGETWGCPRAVMRSAGGRQITTEPLDLAWGPYFPDVPASQKDSYGYPLPLSDAFWTMYGEPLDDFLAVAALFSGTLQDLDPDRHAGEDEADALDRRVRANDTFSGLVLGVHPTFDLTRESCRRSWRAKSLLGSFAMMAYLDLTEGKAVRTCDVCAKPFVSGAYQARYCSARCRQTATQRSYRLRARQRPDDGAESRGEAGAPAVLTEPPGTRAGR
jgi:hypothetical protein